MKLYKNSEILNFQLIHNQSESGALIEGKSTESGTSGCSSAPKWPILNFFNWLLQKSFKQFMGEKRYKMNYFHPAILTLEFISIQYFLNISQYWQIEEIKKTILNYLFIGVSRGNIK